MEKMDVKRLGVPNVCFSLSQDGDKREPEFKQQRIERGFDDSETWSLDFTIAKFVLPRLKRFKEVNNGYPEELGEEGWDKVIDEMIETFELMIKDREGDILENKEYEKIQHGLKLFGHWFQALWW